ncbi:hypothetical protein A3J43_04390 [Candidatus Uhrbacteria bacterium RIFCSPHIGHO2_12_FULL_54_23]|uniref:Winged helix-turn helix domain-containing protein n=3 Tax=Candidatus Uhriibacteriota TaxID=1752732 RepID=A0A1F7UHG0_9BACT|nr:MAG: hypothetical protein A3J43_04390 [Candidatus Uhrbacteria bacterium RIFCSPHIGHO2_12_FULL_54_23]OGL83595.1 MAG: hypothetical protein A3B36_02885 [Candidatus Uhrbacteria bacterium RIFCSPLOWO2_01_FULL_55_36]OGL89957.1 MAG: hypothetical protein A3J36_03115 [Candidatus Uhrbacteria bacterium RIFCSPLOWO2_02_FULL_54_37]
MITVSLTPYRRKHLRERLRHPGDLNPKLLPRIQCVLWRDEGRKPREIARLLAVHRTTVVEWVNLWLAQGERGLLTLHYHGNHRYLKATQEEELARKIEDGMFSRLKEIESWVESRFKVRYSTNGLGKLLKRLKLVKKVPGIVPAKADPRKQRAFLKEVPEIAARAEGVP